MRPSIIINIIFQLYQMVMSWVRRDLIRLVFCCFGKWFHLYAMSQWIKLMWNHASECPSSSSSWDRRHQSFFDVVLLLPPIWIARVPTKYINIYNWNYNRDKQQQKMGKVLELWCCTVCAVVYIRVDCHGLLHVDRDRVSELGAYE